MAEKETKENPKEETEETYDPQKEKWQRHIKRIKGYHYLTNYKKLFKWIRKYERY